MMSRDRKLRIIGLSAGLLGCMQMMLPAGISAAFPGGGFIAYGQEEQEAVTETAPADETEPGTETVLSGTVSSGETKQDAGPDTGAMLNDAKGYLPENVQNAIDSMSSDEIAEYAVMIEKILTNPDFNELMQYDEVRDLVVTLIHNALDFSAEDPALTDQILETLGVDRRVIYVFLALLDSREENKEVADGLEKFLLSEQGHLLTEQLVGSLDEETIDQLLESFQESGTR